MSELGSGSGSSYPGTLDTNNTAEVNSPSASKTKARAEVPNDLAAAIIAIETELGTDPAGTLTDVKTYLQLEHNTDGTHKTVATATTATGIDDQGGGSDIKIKIVEIGDWNMDTTTNVSINHGLTITNIISVQAMIRNDADDFHFAATPGNISSPVEVQLFIVNASSTTVSLSRLTGGVFDNTSYDSTSYNRGWITIFYV